MSLEMPQDDHVMAVDPASRRGVGGLPSSPRIGVRPAGRGIGARSDQHARFRSACSFASRKLRASAQRKSAAGSACSAPTSCPFSPTSRRGLSCGRRTLRTSASRGCFPPDAAKREAAHGLALLTEHERRLLHRLSAAEQRSFADCWRRSGRRMSIAGNMAEYFGQMLAHRMRTQ